MSAHAIRRAAQRNISPGDIEYVLHHGSKFHKAGACFYYLGGKDIPTEDRREDEITRLEGMIVVLDPGQRMVVTIYRDRERGLKEIRKKQDYLATAV